MNATRQNLFIVFAAAALSASACGEVETAPATCDDARAHMEVCFPDQEARTPDTCTPEDAEAIVSQSCDELAASATSAGKGDGFCNPFFWWLCDSSGSDTEPEQPAGYDFRIGLNVCETELCIEDLFGEIRWGAECGKMTLHDERGDVVAVDYLNDRLISGAIQGTGDGFANIDAPAGDYTVRLWRRDGDQARDLEGAPAELAVTLQPDGGVDLEDDDFRILASEAELVRACSDVGGSVASTCGGELQSKEDTEWSWIVKIEGTNSEGRYENYTRSRFIFNADGHLYSFPRVRPGTYTITFIEVDVWSSWTRDDYLNSKYDDYLELVDRYATGLEFTETVEVTEDDVARSEFVNLFHVDLESQVCL